MAERPEDLNLPITVVQRLIKESLPDGVIVAKEARQTISRASSVFVLYLTSCAVAHANKAKRKTLAVNDILAALNDMEFDSFVPSLNESLKFRKDFLAQSANNKKQTKPAAKTAIAEEVDDEIEEAGDGLVDVEAENDEEEEDEEAVVDDEDTNDKPKDSLDISKQTNKKRKLETDEGAANDDYVEVEESESNSSVSSSNSLAAAE